MDLFNHRLRLHADPSRVVVRPFHIAWGGGNGAPPSRTERLVGEVLAMTPQEARDQLETVLKDFEARHWQTRHVFMTRYDQRVVDNIKKHEFALRSVMMDVMRQSQEADINKPEFRVDLAKRLRDAMNAQLEKFEEFGGVEDVFFTSFIVQ